MRQIGIERPQSYGEIQPDQMAVLLLAAATGQAIDLPASATHARLTGLTTAGAQYNFHVMWGSTGAATPSSGATTTTTGNPQPVLGTRTFQISTAGSTCFSVISPTSGYVYAEFWHR